MTIVRRCVLTMAGLSPRAASFFALRSRFSRAMGLRFRPDEFIPNAKKTQNKLTSGELAASSLWKELGKFFIAKVEEGFQFKSTVSEFLESALFLEIRVFFFLGDEVLECHRMSKTSGGPLSFWHELTGRTPNTTWWKANPPQKKASTMSFLNTGWDTPHFSWCGWFFSTIFPLRGQPRPTSMIFFERALTILYLQRPKNSVTVRCCLSRLRSLTGEH